MKQLNFIKTIKNLFEKSVVLNTVKLTDITGSGILQGGNIIFDWGDKTLTNYLRTAYGTNPYVFEVVDDLANRASMIPVKLTDIRQPEREVRELELQSLLKNPNSKESNQEFLYRLFATYLTCGEVFIIGINGIGFTKFSELMIPVATNVTINKIVTGKQINDIKTPD